MSKIIVSEFISLDGVIEGPGPDSSFIHAGWTMPYASTQFQEFKYTELMAADALLLGRVTYDGFAAAWPNITSAGEFGEKMNSMPKFVVSTSLEKPEWNNSTVISKDFVQEINSLKTKFQKDILVFGSATLASMLLENHLVDEYRLPIFPVILGQGRKLFTNTNHSKLTLLETKSFDSGITILRYEPIYT